MATKRNSSGRVTAKKTQTQTEGPADKPTSASQWKAQVAGGTLVRVPSGNTASIRTPGMSVFLEAGVIPNSLLPLIQELMQSPKKGKQQKAELSDEDVAELMDDPQKIQDIISLAKAVTVYCCIDPQVSAVPKTLEGEVIPIGDSRRDPNTLYVDEVEFNDRMYIFAAATGGVAGFEKFREEQAAAMGAV